MFVVVSCYWYYIPVLHVDSPRLTAFTPSMAAEAVFFVYVLLSIACNGCVYAIMSKNANI